jgi:hypothetical protein
MRKRRTLAYLRLLRFRPSRGSDLHALFEVVRVGEAVTPRWIGIKVIVSGELKVQQFRT